MSRWATIQPIIAASPTSREVGFVVYVPPLSSAIFMISVSKQLHVALVDGTALFAMLVASAITWGFALRGQDPAIQNRAGVGCISYIVGGLLGAMAALLLAPLVFPRGSEMFAVTGFTAGFLGFGPGGIIGMLKGSRTFVIDQLEPVRQVQRTQSTAREDMNCPRNGGALSIKTVEETPLYYCERCGGIWIAQSSMHDFLSSRGIDPPLVFKLKHFHPVSVASAKMKCPLDDAKVVAITYRMVEIDICSECRGIWFDAGELEKILGGKMGRGYIIENAIDDIVHFIKTML